MTRTSFPIPRGRCYVAVKLLASRIGELGSIPCGVAPGFPQLGIMLNEATGRWAFSGISRFLRPFIPAQLHTHLTSPSSALKTSISRAPPPKAKGHARVCGAPFHEGSAIVHFLVPFSPSFGSEVKSHSRETRHQVFQYLIELGSPLSCLSQLVGKADIQNTFHCFRAGTGDESVGVWVRERVDDNMATPPTFPTHTPRRWSSMTDNLQHLRRENANTLLAPRTHQHGLPGTKLTLYSLATRQKVNQDKSAMETRIFCPGRSVIVQDRRFRNDDQPTATTQHKALFGEKCRQRGPGRGRRFGLEPNQEMMRRCLLRKKLILESTDLNSCTSSYSTKGHAQDWLDEEGVLDLDEESHKGIDFLKLFVRKQNAKEQHIWRCTQYKELPPEKVQDVRVIIILPILSRIQYETQAYVRKWAACLLISIFENPDGGKTEVPQENPLTNGIVRQNSHMRKSGVTRPGIEPESGTTGLFVIPLGTFNPSGGLEPQLPHGLYTHALVVYRTYYVTYVDAME
ncbi:hypothetical protein PR048_015744, partial [Dryococelus australis]